jgi:hypothetical protein
MSAESNPLFCYSLCGLIISPVYTVGRYYRSIGRRLGCFVCALIMRLRAFILLIVSNAEVTSLLIVIS